MDAEPCAGTASLQFVVKNGAGRVVLRRSGGSVKTGVWIRARFACHLKKGAYRCFVTAQDAAGNVQVKAVSARLTVR